MQLHSSWKDGIENKPAAINLVKQFDFMQFDR